MARPSFFEGLKRETVETSAGVCEMPIMGRDASMFAFGTRVDRALAESCIPEAQRKVFEPWLVFGRATALFCAFEHRDTTIGSYGEVGVGILVKRTGSSPSKFGGAINLRDETNAGWFVVNLPVTSQFAFAAATELWGCPSYLTPVGTDFKKDSLRVTVGDELEVCAENAGGLKTKGISLVLYSTNNGRILRTIVDTDFRASWGGSSNVRVMIKNEGPTSKTMRHLGLDESKPLFAFRSHAMRSVLPLGEDMGEFDDGELPSPSAEARDAAE